MFTEELDYKVQPSNDTTDKESIDEKHQNHVVHTTRSRRESQDLKPVDKVLGETRELQAVLLPLPLGEVDANVVSRRRGRTPTGFDGGSSLINIGITPAFPAHTDAAKGRGGVFHRQKALRLCILHRKYGH